MVPGGSGIGPERALERPHPDPVSAIARKLLLSPRSLRAQDRSRGAPPATHPRLSPIARPTTQPAPKNLNPSIKRKPKRPIPKDRQIATHNARTGGSGIGPERALERRHPDPPSRDSAKAPPVPTFPASAGPIPRSPTRDPPATQPHRQTSNTATHPAPTRSPRPPALTHDASEPLRVLYRK